MSVGARASVLFAAVILVGCAQTGTVSTPSSTSPSTSTPPASSAAAPSAFTPSHATPTDRRSSGPSGAPTVVEVPHGDPVILDGSLSPGEWDGAAHQATTDGGDLYLLHDAGYLYLGLHENFDSRDMALAEVCLAGGDEITILHASASLGTAVFERDGAEWEVTRTFKWQLHELAAQTPDAERQRQAFLDESHWLANLGLMTSTEEFEFQIALPDGPFQLAVAYLLPPTFSRAAWWPAALADDCRKIRLMQGDSGQEMSTPLRLRFDPETWVTIRASAS